MPEMRFSLRWPDGAVSVAYSPSLVMREHLTVGESYELDEFVTRSTKALGIASERVQIRFGYPCSRALSQIEVIHRTAARYASGGTVTVTGFEE